MSLIVFFLFQHAQAATFTVNSTADPGDGVCDATECTLPEAIAAANALPGPDMIGFNISGMGVHTIQPLSNLPVIVDLPKKTSVPITFQAMGELVGLPKKTSVPITSP